MPCSAFPAPKYMTTTRLIWKLRKFAIRWILQTKCVGVWVKFHNLGIFLLAWYRKRFLNHNWRPSWILTSLVIRKAIKPIASHLPSTKHISKGEFCIFLIFRTWDKGISLFGLFFRIFTRGNFSTQIWSYLKNRSIYQLDLNADS